MRRYNYRNPENNNVEHDNYQKIVDDFVESRKSLKKNLDKQKGDIITMRVGEKPLTKDEKKSKPIIDNLKSLNVEIKKGRNLYWRMFEAYQGKNKTQSEIKLTSKQDIGKLGANPGEVNLEDIQGENLLTIKNTKTNSTKSFPLTEDLASLLFKPARDIDFEDIEDGALRTYYDIMLNYAGISNRANNNRKLRRAREVYNRVEEEQFSDDERKDEDDELPPLPEDDWEDDMENPEEDFELFEEEEERGRPAPVDYRPVNYRGEPRVEMGRYFKEGVDVEEGRGRRRNVAKQVRENKKANKMKVRRRQQRQEQDMRGRRQEFQEQGMRQGIGFVNEERRGERRYVPEGRVPVRRRRANRGVEEVRGLDPRRRRGQQGRGLNLMSPDEITCVCSH